MRKRKLIIIIFSLILLVALVALAWCGKLTWYEAVDKLFNNIDGFMLFIDIIGPVIFKDEKWRWFVVSNMNKKPLIDYDYLKNSTRIWIYSKCISSKAYLLR